MKQKILILGVGGMVGHKLFQELSKEPSLDVYATGRKKGRLKKFFGSELFKRIIFGIDVTKFSSVEKVMSKIKPNVVINCTGITKQLVDEKNDPLLAIEINSVFPHKLAKLCQIKKIRMLEIATDCVFNGEKGNYTEEDPSDATDLYGRSKFLGEVYYPNCLTIRTSFIGHEIGNIKHGLLEWFLSQENQTKGFTKAIYTGMPTVEIARVIKNYILPNKKLYGLYQVSSNPISKYDLLKIIAKHYGKKINITPDDSVSIDRSLNSNLFRKTTGYKPLSWDEMVKIMYDDSDVYYKYHKEIKPKGKICR